MKMGRGKKTCSACGTEQGVRSINCIKCGVLFVRKTPVAKAPVEETVAPNPVTPSASPEEIDTVLETTLDPVEPTKTGQAVPFAFKAYSGTENTVGTVAKRKTYERPDVEIAKLEKDKEYLNIYPVPAGVQPYKPTKREKAYQVLGLGKDRATSLLTVAQMENCWRDTDWDYVAEILGEKVVETVEPEPDKDEEESDKGE
jgi:hypothetical protein